jgi:hypothetical protein
MTRSKFKPKQTLKQKAEFKAAKTQCIEELRVTKKAKKDRKEREVQRTPMVGEDVSGSSLSKDDKILRALRKKLKSLEALFEKEAAGHVLDEQQKMKLARLPELMAEFEELQSRNSD